MKQLLLIAALLLLATKASAEPVVVLEDYQERGSGTVIKVDGSGSIILTARHVCMGMVNPSIRTANLTQIYPAEVYRIHISEDVCLLKTSQRLAATRIGHEKPIDEAFVFTLFPGPVTGILMRIVLLDATYVPPFEIHVRWFDGIAHPGMSGSGVLNEKGEVIGVLVLGSSDSMHGGYVELEYIVELLLGINSATRNEPPIYTPICNP